MGDLGQPFHSSVDYDGWKFNQGGIHQYFESDLVNETNGAWVDEVLSYALRFKPSSRLTKLIQDLNIKPNYLTFAVALATDSIKEKNRILVIDRAHSILKMPPKNNDGLRLKPTRKNASEALPYFSQILKERFAVSAELLADLWYLAYKNAGSPTISDYKSYYYPLKPEPIPIDYYPVEAVK